MSSTDATMEEQDSFLSSRDGIIYGISDNSGWGESMISGPNIASSSTSTDDLHRQQISTAAGGGGGDLMITSSSGIYVGTEMDAGTELEEEDTADSTVELDIALSYIDRRLQDVLGHLQKDFEGGVSPENLGPKFGGYGSFLPSCHWPTRTHPEANQNKRWISPNSRLLQSGRRPSLASSSTSKCEIVKKQTNNSDPRAHMMQISDGIENLTTQKSTEIYCALGLDVSPSPSPDDRAMNCEGLSHDPKDS